MKKVLGLIVLSAVHLFAGKSPFSTVRTVAWDAAGQPAEEAIDLTICLEREVSEKNNGDPHSRDRYESIIKYWADGIYEMSNGGNYLGNVKIFSGGEFANSCDVSWKKEGVWPNAYIGSYNSSSGTLNVSDEWAKPQKYDYLESDRRRFEFAMTLTHESMHYLYGLRDEYGTVKIAPSYKMYLSADPQSDMIHIESLYDNTYESSQLDALYSGQYVYFYDSTGTVPSGIQKDYSSSSWLSRSYLQIDELVWAEDGSPSISFNLKDSDGNRVDIKDEGANGWVISIPPMAGSTAHAVQNTQWPLSSFKYGVCGQKDIPWQWANLSTEFNFNPYSKQGLTYKNSAGKSFSGWEVVVSNPINDVFYKNARPWTRFWFKSLINRAPKANDVYATRTHYLNYNEATGTWADGDASWREGSYCNTKEVSLPYMKVELAGQTEEQYSKITRKHLNIQWMSGLKAEVVVVMDHSGSMTMYDKMEQAKLASKYVATGFMGAGSGFSSVDVSVGVYSFNQEVSELYALQNNPDKNVIYNAITSVTANGQTALFDALDQALNAFTDDASSLKLLYVVSDGLDNASEKTKQQIVDLYNSKKVAIHTFAYGKDADVDLLASMAAETGGTFYDQQDNIALKVNEATTAVLSNTLGIEQIAASSLKPGSRSSEIFVPKNAGRVRVYGSYEGSTQQNPIDVISGNGAKVAFSKEDFLLGEVNYFIAEIDSVTLAKNSVSRLVIRNNMASQELDFRTLLSEKITTYGMSVGMDSKMPYRWPQQVGFTASVSGREGVLTGVSASGKLKQPDGSTRQFDLYDDGTHGDVLAGDGVFFGYMPSVNAKGSYQWEISISNKEGHGHTTRIGTSLPDSIDFVEVSDSEPFELLRNGQFVVNECCSEDIYTIQPEEYAYGYLQNGEDRNQFKVIGTKVNQAYSLIVSTDMLSSLEKIEIFAPQDMDNPLYSTNIKDNSSGKNMFLLGTDLVAPGNYIVVSSNRSEGANYSMLLIESNEALFAVGQFEKDADWHTDYSLIALDRKIKSEGVSSLSTVAGWKVIESRNIATSEFKLVGDKLSLDVYVPASSQNQYWLGTVELWAYVPSSNKRIQLGVNLPIQPSFNTWVTYDFTVPDEVKSMLNEPHPDFRFQLVLNSADFVWVDNLRFTGRLVENEVGKYEPRCPGEEGCDAEHPIRLSINKSIDFVATGELWIEVVDFPEDWTPSSLFVNLSPLDGAKLTGNLGYAGRIYPLADWDYQRMFEYERDHRYLFKVYNIGGRPYRMNAWVFGQTVNLASLDRSPDWNVVF